MLSVQLRIGRFTVGTRQLDREETIQVKVDWQQRKTRAHPVKPSALLTFGHSGTKKTTKWTTVADVVRAKRYLTNQTITIISIKTAKTSHSKPQHKLRYVKK